MNITDLIIDEILEEDELLGSDELMGDWSWRPRPPFDPGYAYTDEEIAQYEAFAAARPGETFPARREWSVSAWGGMQERPARIGG